jgi:hypothetical protein
VGSVVLGVLIVVVISSIPAVGGWLAFLIALFGLGAFILEMLASAARPAAELTRLRTQWFPLPDRLR